MSQEVKPKKPATTRKQSASKVKPKAQETKESWVHIDNYLLTLDVRDEVKQGFRIYMKRQAYQKSYEAFQSHFEKFLKRKI